MTKAAYITANMVLVLGLSTSGVNAQTSQRETAVDPLSTSQFSCAASGTGANYMKICVSKQGNVVSFESPQGSEHIRVGQVIEGYAICGHQHPNEFEAYNYGANSDFADAYKVQQPNGKNTFPLTLSIKAGEKELVQTFARNAANRELTITMRLYNRSAQTFYISRIRRAADFDINKTPKDDVFVKTLKTIIASDAYGGMSLTGPGRADVFTYGNFGGSCFSPEYPEGMQTPPGDYVGVSDAAFGRLLPKNGFVEAKFIYRVID